MFSFFTLQRSTRPRMVPSLSFCCPPQRIYSERADLEDVEWAGELVESAQLNMTIKQANGEKIEVV
jgi:hypothetical protein